MMIKMRADVAYSGEIIGDHVSMVEMRRLISRIAVSPAQTVLVYGETGTGKGLVARKLHENSDRAGGSFVNINCAAIPANLMESELFGYEKGAFTGALTKKQGLVEAANGGTVFLDEIRELELVLQAKLLSLLDTQEFRRVGAVQSQKVDVRFIVATNKILSGEVRNGRFRDDLYYRLQVVSVNVPPLRSRGDDVLVLAEYFMRKLNARYGRSISTIEQSVQEIFLAYPWPGNVRELENLLERIFILEEGTEILMRHIPSRITRVVYEDAPVLCGPKGDSETVGSDFADDQSLNFHARTSNFQRHMIEHALASETGITATAQMLGISRHALHHQIKKLGL